MGTPAAAATSSGPRRCLQASSASPSGVAESWSVTKPGLDRGWLTYNGKRYWVGTADPFGLLIYDPDANSEVRGDRVNLFIVDQRRTAPFVADTVRDIVRAVETVKAEHAKVVAEYAEAWGPPRPRSLVGRPSTASKRRAREATAQQSRHSPRETYCWSCKEDLSSEFDAVCEACGGIRCSCGACFCDGPAAAF